MQVDDNQVNEPEVDLLPAILNTPSRLICRFGWGDVTTREFLKCDFDQLVLSGGREQGFSIPDLGPKALEVKNLDISAAGVVEGIEQFANIEAIDVTFMPKNGVNLSVFKHLRRVYSDRNKPIEKQIATLPKLQSVAFMGYSGVDCSAIACLSELKTFGLTQGRLQSLDGLEKCRQLECVSLAYLRNLTEVGVLEKFAGLKELHLQNLPKLSGTISVSTYTELQYFYVVECGLSVDLSGLNRNKHLKKLWLNVQHRNLSWPDLFSLRDLSLIGLLAGDAPPDDQELKTLSATHGHKLQKIERAGKGKMQHLRLHFEERKH